MFARIRAAGTWIGVIASSELDTLDLNLSRAIDGYAGGSYAPSSPIVIGGAGMIFSGDTRIEADLAVVGAITIGGGLSVGSSLVIGGESTFNGQSFFQAKVNGPDFSFVGNGTLGASSSNTLTVKSTSTFEQSVALSKGATVTSDGLREGSVCYGYLPQTFWGWNGNATIDGHIRYHRIIYARSIEFSDDRTLTITYDGVNDEQIVIYYCATTHYKLTISAGATNITTIKLGWAMSGTQSLYPQKATLVWKAETSRWEIAEYQPDYTEAVAG